MSEELTYLDGLLTHPGYLLFKTYARKEWGPEGYGRKIKLAISDAKDRDSDISAAVAAVDYANDQINALLSWPEYRVKVLKEQTERDAQGPMLSRRGPVL